MASLNTKVIGGLGVVFVGTIIIAASAMVIESRMGAAMERASRSAELIRKHMYADMMHDALRADVLAALASRDPSNGVSLTDAANELGEHLADFKEAIAGAKALAHDDKTRAALEAVEGPLGGYGEAAEALVARVAADPEGAGAAMPAFKAQFDQLADAMEAASEEIEAVAKADLAAADALKRRAQVLSIGILAAVAGLVAVLAVLARRTIVGPLNDVTRALGRLTEGDLTVEAPHAGRNDEIGRISQAVRAFREAVAARQAELEAADQRDAMEADRRQAEDRRLAAERAQSQAVGDLAEGLGRLAEGDLTVRLNGAFAADYEKLRRDFNAAADALADAMNSVANVTSAIGNGAGEISHAADDLARRTEQQAASLEQTAATLDQITTNVKKTAAGANQARGFVSTAAEDAGEGAKIVDDAVHAMERIRQSSEKISQIIGVIDEIAFQTNLLALNAGVEAARAGETGRGFAVVASEVRALAQRSADAAKEIKGLIDASSAEVSEGVDLVGRTGEALNRLGGHVHQINTVVSDIAASAQEQAAGLNEINAVVNQMDQVTQQNAAMVEETTAASHSLSREAEQLGELMRRFRLEGRPAAAAAAPLPVIRAAARGGAARQLAPEPAADGWEEF